MHIIATSDVVTTTGCSTGSITIDLGAELNLVKAREQQRQQQKQELKRVFDWDGELDWSNVKAGDTIRVPASSSSCWTWETGATVSAPTNSDGVFVYDSINAYYGSETGLRVETPPPMVEPKEVMEDEDTVGTVWDNIK